MTANAGGSNAAHPLLQPDVAALQRRRIEEEIDAIEAAQVALTRAKERAGGRADRKAYADYGATLDNIPDCLARLSEERAGLVVGGSPSPHRRHCNAHVAFGTVATVSPAERGHRTRLACPVPLQGEAHE